MWALAPVLSLAVAPASASAIAGPDYYGANIQPMVKLALVTPDRWDLFTQAMADSGMRIARADGDWSWVEPTAPSNGVHTYTWDPPDRPSESMDAIVALLARHGVRLSASLTTAPSWALASGTQLAPTQYADFAAFAGAFAARYGSRGTFWDEHPELPRLPVQEYEVWSEANSSQFWTGAPDPAAYVAALKLVAPAVHAGDPAGRVLASIGWQDFEHFTSELYSDGITGFIDGIGFHPYAPTAPAIIDLVARMRAVLTANGDGALPIYVTEIGQPRSPSGTGATHAGDGPVSDGARAATQSLAGDALARSNCDSQSYLLYAIVGSETSAERFDEGYMGIYNLADATPNATGQAIRNAQARWQAAPSSGLVLCSPGTTPAAQLLPLGLPPPHSSGTCASGAVSYYGNPLEGAQLTLRTADGRIARSGSDAFGQSQVCVAPGPKVSAFAVDAEITNVAMSAVYTCPVTPGPCVSGSLPVGRAVSTGATATCRLSGRIVHAKRHRAEVRVKLSCGKRRLRVLIRQSVYVQRRGTRTRHYSRHVTLHGNKTLTFTVRARLHRGDRIVILHGADPRRQIARYRKTLTAARAVIGH